MSDGFIFPTMEEMDARMCVCSHTYGTHGCALTHMTCFMCGCNDFRDVAFTEAEKRRVEALEAAARWAYEHGYEPDAAEG